jgi:hypothetical protein
MSKGWIGFDLDGTLAHYDEWRGVEVIGAPIPLMVRRLRRYLDDGYTVKIFTARVSEDNPRVVPAIHEWLAAQGLPPLEVTNVKDFGMIILYDDRCVQVYPNTGRTLQGSIDELNTALGRAINGVK